MIVGCFVPDFKYLISALPGNHFGHTWRGALELDLPIALAVFWVFEYVMKEPGIALLPDALRLRLKRTEHHSIGNQVQFLLVLASILIGIASHILWDSFTHGRGWFYRHWPLLNEYIQVTPRHVWPVYKILQNASTVLGTLLVLAWMVWWYWTTGSEKDGPETEDSRKPAAPGWILGVMLMVAMVGGVARGVASSHGSRRGLVLVAGFTFVLVLWWELVGWGLIFRMRGQRIGRKPRPEHSLGG